MSITIHWASGSLYSWRVLLTLEAKGAKYESKLISFSDREHKSPEFLAMNPHGRVPVVETEDGIFYEWMSIAAYLDRKYPEPGLQGSTPVEAGRIWQVISELSFYLDHDAEKFVVPAYFGGIEGKEEEIKEGAKATHFLLKQYEAMLNDGSWLVGDKLSLADIGLYPQVQTILRAANKESMGPFELGFLPFEQVYPKLAGWCKKVEALPNYDRTYPPHWRG